MPALDPSHPARTVYLPLKAVKVSLVQQMYELHERTHEHASLDAFTQELKRQTGVLLLRRQPDQRIVGFSTQSLCTLSVEGETVRGLFTGPLVVDPEYPARHALRRAVFRRLFLERLKRPMAPLYWFFTAPGLQDYLSMTQSFPHHYPNIHGSRQAHLALAQALGVHLFPHAFDRSRMLLDFAEGHMRLKGVDQADALQVELPEEAKLRAFFEGLNPTWRAGTELPCLAECDWASLWRGMQRPRAGAGGNGPSANTLSSSPQAKRRAGAQQRVKPGQPS